MMQKHLLAVAVSGVAALALVSPGADAAPHQRSTASGVAVKHLDSSKAEHDRIVAYWTPQRMRNAIPADVLVANRDKSSATGKVATGKPYVVQPQAKPGGGGSAGTGSYYTGGGHVIQTTGKVFFTEKGLNYVCSGSATASANGSVVTTAGHCVNEGPGAFVTNWSFVPQYDDGARPFGTFTATSLYTTTQWQTSGDFNYDVGFAKVTPLNGKTLVQTVGSQGIGFNLPRGQVMYSFGYPAANPYDGTDIAYCFGTVFDDNVGGSTDQGMNCNLTGGSSGGPWLQNFNTSTTDGTIASLNSFTYRGVKNIMWGPYFGSVIQTTYNTAQS